MNEVTIANIVERWSGLERPLFKGKLIDSDGCKCAQGDALFCAGYTDKQLRAMDQRKADLETARILGISVTHSILLRSVNDKQGGCPQLVLTNPEQIIGHKAPLLLAFWFHLDNMSDDARDAAGDDAGDAAWYAARDAAWYAAWYAAGDDARYAARYAAWDSRAARAASEIQGMDILERDGRQPYFLAFFGFDTWDKVKALGGAK